MAAKKLDEFTVQITETIRDAMLKINANKSRAVVGLDGATVVGTISDGDIRRAFLKDIMSIAPVEEIITHTRRTPREREPKKLQELLQKERLTLLPVVDQSNALIDVALG